MCQACIANDLKYQMTVDSNILKRGINVKQTKKTQLFYPLPAASFILGIESQ